VRRLEQLHERDESLCLAAEIGFVGVDGDAVEVEADAVVRSIWWYAALSGLVVVVMIRVDEVDDVVRRAHDSIGKRVCLSQRGSGERVATRVDWKACERTNNAGGVRRRGGGAMKLVNCDVRETECAILTLSHHRRLRRVPGARGAFKKKIFLFSRFGSNQRLWKIKSFVTFKIR
jgi:hypothetical protein